MQEEQTLHELLSAAQPTHREAATIAANLARYLSSIHSGGGAYLRLSPHTVIVERGLNVHLRSDPGPDGAGEASGYRAPEQVRGGEGDWRSDCWSLGVLFCRLYGGESPFRIGPGESLEAFLLSEEPADLTTLTGPAAGDAQRILELTLAKEPAARYSSTAELVSDLDSLCRRLVSRSAVGGGVPTADAAPSPVARTPARGQDDLRSAVAERRAEWAQGDSPNLWLWVGLPSVALLALLGLLLYCGGGPENGSTNAGGNVQALPERFDVSESSEAGRKATVESRAVDAGFLAGERPR